MNMNDFHDRLSVTMSYEEAEALLKIVHIAKYEFLGPEIRKVLATFESFLQSFLRS
jgi:hypothetical protein